MLGALMVIMITTGLRVHSRRLPLLFGPLVSAGLKVRLGLVMLLVPRVFCKHLEGIYWMIWEEELGVDK
jgi:hypothetical protein